MKKRQPKPLWPPAVVKREHNKVTGGQIMHPGEPSYLRLSYFDGDRAARAYEKTVCCDCGLTHFMIYEVFRSDTGQFWLQARAYRDQDHTELRKKAIKAASKRRRGK